MYQGNTCTLQTPPPIPPSPIPPSPIPPSPQQTATMSFKSNSHSVTAPSHHRATGSLPAGPERGPHLHYPERVLSDRLARSKHHRSAGQDILGEMRRAHSLSRFATLWHPHRSATLSMKGNLDQAPSRAPRNSTMPPSKKMYPYGGQESQPTSER